MRIQYDTYRFFWCFRCSGKRVKIQNNHFEKTSFIILLFKFSIFNHFKTVSAFGQNNGVGNLANGFSLNLSTPGERFIMGGQLEVAIEWSARFLGQFSFRIKDCSVQHGEISVSVIKKRALRFIHKQWGDRLF